MLASKPDMGKTAQGFDYARFTVGLTSFSVHAEPEGGFPSTRWTS